MVLVQDGRQQRDSRVLMQLVGSGAVRSVTPGSTIERWRDESPWSTAYLRRELSSMSQLNAHDASAVVQRRCAPSCDWTDMFLHREWLAWGPWSYVATLDEFFGLTPAEIIAAYMPIRLAQGRVAVAGIRSGYTVQRMLTKSMVDEVVVYEADQQLLTLYERNFGDHPKLRLVQQDEVASLAGEHFDVFCDARGTRMLSRRAMTDWPALMLRNHIARYHARGVEALLCVVDSKRASSYWLARSALPGVDPTNYQPFAAHWLHAVSTGSRMVQRIRELSKRVSVREGWENGFISFVQPGTQRVIASVKLDRPGPPLARAQSVITLSPGVTSEVLTSALRLSSVAVDDERVRVQLIRWQRAGMDGEPSPRGAVYYFDAATAAHLLDYLRSDRVDDSIHGGDAFLSRVAEYRHVLVVGFDSELSVSWSDVASVVCSMPPLDALGAQLDDTASRAVRQDSTVAIRQLLESAAGDPSLAGAIQQFAERHKDWVATRAVLIENITNTHARRAGFDALLVVARGRTSRIGEVVDLTQQQFPSCALQSSAPTATFLDKYRPAAGWFREPDGIHGVAHAARVLVLANELSERLMADGVHVDRDVVRWAAVVHDVGRLDDGADLEHGERSADWFLTHARDIASHLTEQQRQRVADAVRWHVPWDDEVPVQAQTPEWICLKDADAIDRLRFDDLDVRLLRTDHARTMVGWARLLVAATRGCDHGVAWHRVAQLQSTAAHERGWL